MKKLLRLLAGLSLALSFTFPAFAISPYADFNRPTQIKSTFQEQQPVQETAPAQNQDQTREQDVKAIQNALKLDELDQKNTMRDALRQENLEDKIQGNSDLELALTEKKVDVHLGKSLVDMHGNRVRMEEYVLRPAANQVQFLNLTMRDQRLDYIKYTATFNDALPRNTNGLWHKEFGRTKPGIYLTDETGIYSNMSDAITLNVKYFTPTFDALTQKYMLPVQQNSFSVNQIVKWGVERVSPTDSYTDMPNAIGAAGYKAELINHNFLARRATWTWKDGTTTTLEAYMIDEKGDIRSLDPRNVNDWIYWMQHFSDLALNSYTEMIWTSTEFQGRTIDTVSQFQTLVNFFADDDAKRR
jgi:hypothetical protein